MDNPFRLEFLPNELLMYIFRYLQPEDLFRSFYNLNIRLNILLQTLDFLSLTPNSNHSNDENYFPYIHGLIMNRAIDIDFTIFTQIRFLILRYPTEKTLNQLTHQTFPYLEHLRINHMHISLINHNADLCRKVFSNIFPRLISCYLFQWEKIMNIQGWTYSSLRVLKIGIIDLLVYKTILSICPNLYFLQFATVISNNKPMEIVEHKNLRRMIIKTTGFIPSWNHEDISICFSYVPRLEYLTIYRSDTFIPSWFLSIITSQLSFLRFPNEIFIYLFQYFDAQDLFQSFYNLNNRFNNLLESLHYLSLTLGKSNSNNYQIFAPYVYTLKLDSMVNINLEYFTNIHRIILLSPTSNQLKQLVFNDLPCLEHLTIGYEHFLFSSYLSDLCEKIFSQNFPRLTSCYLFEPRILEIIPSLTQSTRMRVLKMDNIDVSTYKDLLSLCPNLYFLQFTMVNQQEEFCSINPHINLKRLVIKFQNLSQIYSDYRMKSYLTCVPCLEQLNVYEMNFDGNIREYLNSQWLSSLINQSLLKYVLYIYGAKENDEEIINQLQRNFQCMKFEDLPNELLIEIFEYTDIRDLFYGFWGLNKRINDVLRVLQNLSYNLERLDPGLIALFSKQITHLIVNTWQEVDLHQFPYLYSLSLNQATTNQLKQIRSEILPHLVYLKTSSLPQISEQIFSNAMPTIRYVKLGHIRVPFLHYWSQSPCLSSVSIQTTNPTLIPYILQSSPNLTYFEVHFLMDTIAIFGGSPVVSNHPLKQFILSDPYHKLSFNHIHRLFLMIPNLRKVHLNFLCKIPFIRFAQSLTNRLHYLKEFNCKIDDASFDRTTTIETIRKLHPCFQNIYCSTNDLHFRIFTTEIN